jgi:nucleolar GTP-binding protein
MFLYNDYLYIIMNFQNLQTIENYEFYVDVAFGKAKKKADQVRGTKSKKEDISKIKTMERARMDTVVDAIKTHFERIISSYPDFDSISEFYQELIQLYYPIDNLKKSLSTLDWAIKRISELARQSSKKMKDLNSKDAIETIRKSFYGRVVSVLKQVNPHLMKLEEARKDLKKLPSIKDSLFTIAIVGFPNVGKSTLLGKLTFSKPEAKAYAFTTKVLNLGYARINHEKIQFIDTPGSLNRKKMNNIERHAELAMKYLADVLIYVFDLSEEYPLDLQLKLYREVQKEYPDKPLMVYLSKTDIISKEVIDSFIEKYNLNCITDSDKIMSEIEPYYMRRI